MALAVKLILRPKAQAQASENASSQGFWRLGLGWAFGLGLSSEAMEVMAHFCAKTHQAKGLCGAAPVSSGQIGVVSLRYI